MSLSRRALVRLAAASAAVPLLPACPGSGKDDTADTGAPLRSPEPPPWDAPGAEDLAAFPLAPVLGDATTSGARLGLYTTLPTVELVVMEADGEGWVERERRTLTPVDGYLSAELTGLAADTAYALALYADVDRRSPVLRLRTAAATERVVVFGATSCLGGHNPEQPSLAFVPDDALDFFCLLGDFVYADGSRTLEDYRAFYQDTLAIPAVRAALASTSVVATWDDHELDNNWSWEDVDQAWYDVALACFREALPQGVGPSGGMWRKLSWGPTVDVFVLDCRSERRDGNYVSAAQMDWLKAELAASTARFKILLNSVPITDLSALFGDSLVEDRWQGYPAQREEILAFVRDQGLAGVLWVTGDVHFAAVTRVDPEGGTGAGQWEVFTGPAGSTPNVLVDVYTGNPQYEWLSSAWNWARFTCDPAAGTVLVEFIGDDGSVLHSAELAP